MFLKVVIFCCALAFASSSEEPQRDGEGDGDVFEMSTERLLFMYKLKIFPEDATLRKLNGDEIDIEEAPHHVLYGSGVCGGSLIAPNWVLTAAHCGTAEDYVTAGSAVHSKGKKHKVQEHYPHPEYLKNKTEYDYMLLQLEKPVPVTEHSKPVEIGIQKDIDDGGLVAVTGWAPIDTSGEHNSPNLQRTYTPVLDEDHCNRYYSNNKGADNTFCAGSRPLNTQSCMVLSGDGGLINGKLVGVASEDGMCTKPDVYVNVPEVRYWIRDVTEMEL